MKKKEIVVLFLVCLLSMALSVIFYLSKEKGNVVVIYSDGVEYRTLLLDKDTEITIKEKNNLCIKDGEAFVNWADCPDKLCIKQGKITETGKSIVCLPNKLTIKIEKR